MDLLETLEKMKELIDSGSASTQQLSQLINNAVPQASTLTKTLSGAGKAAKEVKTELSEIEEFKFSALTSSLEKMGEKLKSIGTTEMVALGSKFLMIVSAGTGLSKIPAQFDAIGRSAREASIGAADIGDSFARLKQIKPELAGTAGFKFFEQLTAQADAAKNLENRMLMNAAAAGQMGKMWELAGNDLKGLERQSLAFTDLSYNVAQATGLTTGEVANYANMLSQIPGAMESVIDASTREGKSMHLLEAAIKVASGTGQSMNDVLGDMKTLFMNVGMQGDSAVDAISRMSAASDKTRLPLDIVKSYTKDAANQFKVFGNNTNAAINILTQFGTALNDRMGPEAIREVTSAFTSGIKQMDIAQKAFVATQTGSKGLLSGAFEIDLALKKGNLDEVAGRVRESMMQQFGGRIVSLEEAANDEAAASQMALQVQMLRQGPLGSLAQTTEQAYAVLDMFTKSSEMTAEELKNLGDPEDAMTKALGRGEKLEEHQVNILNQISNKFDRLTALTAIQSYNALRGLGGGEDTVPFLRELMAKTGMGTAQMETSGAEAAAIAKEKEKGTSSNVDEVIKETIHKFGGDIKDVATANLDAIFSKIGFGTEEKEQYKKNILSKTTEKHEEQMPKGAQFILSLLGVQKEVATPGERVADTMMAGRQQETEDVTTNIIAKRQDETAKSVNVNVTTVCSECQKSIAKEVLKEDKVAQNMAIHVGGH